MVDIEIRPVGGYSDFGRNMTVVKVGREAVVFDMGIRLDRVLLDEEAVFDEMHPVDLQRLGAIPDTKLLKNLDAKVVAIVIGHAHLDHVGAVPKLAGEFKDAPIYGTPYTIRFIREQTRLRHGGKPKDGKEQRSIPNKLVEMNAGEEVALGRSGLKLEFVHTTHSIVQTVFPVLHTDAGAIVYAVDYKFDNTPVIGHKPDYKRLRQLAAEGVAACIVESTNAGNETKTPSETIARDMLKDYLFGVENDGDGLIVTTFSSHIARIQSICEFGEKLGRKVVLMGRSMDKYSSIARDLGLLNLPKGIEIAGHQKAVQQVLRRAADHRDEYLLVGTGHQGEPDSFLPRLASKQYPYEVSNRDQVIFSANTIPHPVNVANRYLLETKLRMQGARIMKGAHVSGHASRVDHQELLRMLEPQHLFPNHGGIDLQSAFVELAAAEGYRLNESVHVLRNGERHRLGV
ncbi:MAG TPA: RNase J family beta-CASP ribonuclease [Candidatus Thermoplasmatota archaeon]|nr:RNase J family beta-CASP ribonuclease [Candidatus Thermoplasmatota archaeon]